MALNVEHYIETIMRPQKIVNAFAIEPGTFQVDGYLMDAEIFIYVSPYVNFSRIRFASPQKITGRKYLDELDWEGVDVNIREKNRVKLIPGQELYLEQKSNWRETRAISIWLPKE